MGLREFVGKLERRNLWLIPLLAGMALISIVFSFLAAVVTGLSYLAHGAALVLGVRL